MNFKRSILLTLVFAIMATTLTNCSSSDKKEEPAKKKDETAVKKDEPKATVEPAKSTDSKKASDSVAGAETGTTTTDSKAVTGAETGVVSTATDASRALANGECIGNCKNGEGMLGFSDGSKYQGQFKEKRKGP